MPEDRPDRTPVAALSAAQIVLIIALSAAVIEMGAFYPRAQVACGRLLAVALALTVLSPSARRMLGSVACARTVGPVVAALAALGGWAVARAAIAGDHVDGLRVAALCAALAAVFVIGHAATALQRQALQRAVVALGAVSAASGWLGFVGRREPLALAGSVVWRAAGTVTYENALACVIAVSAAVVVAELLRRDHDAGRGVLCLLLTGGAASQSRGGIVALLAATLVLAAVVGWRPLAQVLVRPVAGAAVAAAALLPSVPVSVPARPGVATAGLCIGLAIAAWPRAERTPAAATDPRAAATDRPAGRPTRRRAAVIAAAVLLTVAAVLTLTVRHSDLSALRGRVSLSSVHRIAQHRAALTMLTARPLLGTGPGRGELHWRDGDGRNLSGRFVHDEYVQVALELGLVGALLLLALLIALARALWRGRGAGGLPWAGAVAGVTAVATHGALDFVWHLPVIPLMALLLAGTVTPPARPRHRPEAPPTAAASSTARRDAADVRLAR